MIKLLSLLLLFCAGILLLAQTSIITLAQDQAELTAQAQTNVVDQPALLAGYIDQTGGITCDEAVAYALAHNGELAAARKELEAAQNMVKQARLRANPSLEINGSRQIPGKDNSIMATGMLPLELGGRRNARIVVAMREVTVREKAVANLERTLAAEVRAKFGTTVAQTLKLKLTGELLDASLRGFRLVQARVTEGKIAPLEENITLVEVNRLRSMRETEVGKTQVLMLELRNMLGMKPEEPLRLRGDFNDLIATLPSVAEETERALKLRPDLQAMRAIEEVAEAQIEQARAEGRYDASLNVGYQRMNSSFPVNGFTETGALSPVQGVFHFLTFGVTIQIPVRNKNQGSIGAATANAEAARQRREFAEITVRREVAAAYARYEYAARAMQIFRAGAIEQANANLNVVRQTYELGSRNLLDYITEQRRYIELETEFIDAQLETYLARVEIARVTAAPELIKR